jgi:hypothetical protein
MISLLLLVSSYVFGVSMLGEKEKNVFGAFLSILICIVLCVVALDAYKLFLIRTQPNQAIQEKPLPIIDTSKIPEVQILQNLEVQSPHNHKTETHLTSNSNEIKF